MVEITKPLSLQDLKKLLVCMLQGKSFNGSYFETRLVDKLQQYRDIIKIEGTDPLIPIIEALLPNIKSVYLDNSWISITTSTERRGAKVYYLWTELPEKVFGPWNFLIENIDFQHDHIEFVIHPKSNSISEKDENEPLDVSEILNKSKEIAVKTLFNFCMDVCELMTVQNFYQALKFAIIVICTIGASALNATQYLVELIYALSHLVQSLTPVANKIVETIGKVIGGILILVSMMWRDFFSGRKANNPYQQRNSIEYYPQYERKRN